MVKKENSLNMTKLNKEPKKEKNGLIAKKNFKICRNEDNIEILEGKNIDNVPSVYHENLKTEGVI